MTFCTYKKLEYECIVISYYVNAFKINSFIINYKWQAIYNFCTYVNWINCHNGYMYGVSRNIHNAKQYKLHTNWKYIIFILYSKYIHIYIYPNNTKKRFIHCLIKCSNAYIIMNKHTIEIICNATLCTTTQTLHSPTYIPYITHMWKDIIIYLHIYVYYITYIV